MLEQYSYSKTNLVPLLLQSFDKKFIFPSTKNFLRFSKGYGFKEICNTTLIENTYSEFFLLKIKEQLLKNDKITKDFMN